MPRPNQPRTIAGESTLARRVEMERENRDLTYEALASRMTEAGCAIQPSAIYKIEKTGRRITFDEFLGFAAAFEIPIADLVRPREVAVNARLTRLFDSWEEARQESLAAGRRQNEAFQKMARFVQSNHEESLDSFFEMVSGWAAENAETDTEAAVIRAMVLASAIPVEPFKKLESEALDRLAAERVKSDG